MNEASLDRFANMFAETAMVATVEIGRSKGVDFSKVDLDALIVELRAECRKALDRFFASGKALVDGGMSPWLSQLARVECTEAARAALATVCGV